MCDRVYNGLKLEGPVPLFTKLNKNSKNFIPHDSKREMDIS